MNKEKLYKVSEKPRREPTVTMSEVSLGIHPIFSSHYFRTNLSIATFPDRESIPPGLGKLSKRG